MTNRTDNFNRADNPTSLGTPSDSGSAWVAQAGTWGISSDTAFCSTTTSQQNIATLESSVSDVDVQETLSTIGANADGGPTARFADTNNYLLWIYSAGTGIRMFKVVGGSFTQLGSTVSYTASNGDVFKFSVSGSTLNGYVNGTLKIGPITDGAGSTNTKHGMRSFPAVGSADSMRYDTFSITANGATFTAVNRRTLGPRVGSRSVY